MYDVIIVGAGVTGSFTARNLSKYKLKIAVLEKNSDVCCGSTRANSAIIHSGYSGKPGSLKAKLTKWANEDFHNVCKDLDVEFKRVGSLMMAVDEEGIRKMYEKYERGLQNEISGLRILERDEILAMEPNLNPEVKKALYAPTTGVVNPWEFGTAAMENAMDNGAELFLDTKVQSIETNEDGTYSVNTDKGGMDTRYVINCAGVFSDEVNDMVAEPFFRISPRKGEYIILDKDRDDIVKHVIFQARDNEDVKGVIVLPTVHGNILVGPSTEDMIDKEDTRVSSESLEYIKKISKRSIANLPFDTQIRTFAGVRPRPQILGGIDPETGEPSFVEDDVKDFIIGEAKGHKNFINCAGIKSPGLTCSNEIGKYIASIIKEKEGEALEENPDFSPKRRKLYRFKEKTSEEKAKLIQKNSQFGNIICRCNCITEAEVVDVIKRNCGAKTVDGVKRRAGTGMGRCQGGFCMPHITAILERELSLENENISKDQGESFIFTGTVR